MPKYLFRVPTSAAPVPVELEDDDTAWSEAVVLLGELLKEAGGKMPSGAEWDLTVCEGKRHVATVTVIAQRHMKSD